MIIKYLAVYLKFDTWMIFHIWYIIVKNCSISDEMVEQELYNRVKKLKEKPGSYDFLYSIGVWLYFPLKAVEK